MWEDVISSQLEIATDFLTAKTKILCYLANICTEAAVTGLTVPPPFFFLSLNDVHIFTFETTRASTYLAP